MKKLMLPVVLFASVLFFSEAKTQVRLNVNLNIGTRPDWGLPGNYGGDYYYLPEIDMYYYIPQRQFVYLDGDRWTFASELPYVYRDYDLYNGYKVCINEPRPYLRDDFYRERYNRYAGAYRRPEVFEDRRRPDYDYYNSRNDERFEERNERFEQRNQRFENRRPDIRYSNNNERFANWKGEGHDHDENRSERGGDNGRFNRGNGNENDHDHERHGKD
ncbi:MAG: hypothetical protein NVSMB7_13200 [Chitinophagaceae bacterium]